MENFESKIREKSNEELVDIFINAQDYQPQFVEIVEKELKSRNIPIASVKKIQEKASEVSDKKIELGERGNPIWVTFCFLFALMGGIYSIVGGYIYAFSKRKNSKGEAFFVYDEQTRKYGKWMLIVGGIILTITLSNQLYHMLLL